MDLLSHYLQIVLLGIVEGVTEFLPISSTGHLLIAESFLGTKEPDIFNVVIQAGAILAVVFIYWRKITDLLSNLDSSEARSYLGKILLAFFVTSALILVLQVKFKLKLPEELEPVAWATLIGGFVIFGLEAFAKHLYAHEDVSWFESVLVGAAQVVAALFPGASRSGSTIMAGLAVGMKRPSVTEFSFLVGIPTMFAASAFEIHKTYKESHGLGISHQVMIDTAIGFVVSLIVAFFVVKWLLRFVISHTFNGFALYRVILGGGLLIGLYTHTIPNLGAEPAKPAAAVQTVPGESMILTPAVPITPPPAPAAAPVTNAPAAPSTNAAPALENVPAPTGNQEMPVVSTNASPPIPVPATNAAP